MSTSRLRALRASLVLLVSVLAAPPALGLAQRTFVASYGFDTDPCSLAKPCRSFGAAIAQVIVGGEVIALDSAAYGPVSISQSVSIIGPAGVYVGISVIPPTNTVGVTINGSGINVVLQNIAINALGGTYGIQVLQAASVDVIGCAISNFVGAGVYSTAANLRLLVRDTLVRGSSGGAAPGVWLSSQSRALFERVHVVGNAGVGIRIEAAADATVKGGVVAGNGGAGISVNAAAGLLSALTVEDSLLADNTGDGISATSAAAAGAVTEVNAARNTLTRNGGYGVSVTTTAPGTAAATLTDNLISQQTLDGVFVSGNGALATANSNTFAGNGTSALHAVAGATIHTVKGADGLPNNAGEQATPTIGTVVPANAF